MIEILGMQLSNIPCCGTAEGLLQDDFYSAWQMRHKGLRENDARCASLSGLLLLQAAGVSGVLAYDRLGRPYLCNSRLDFNITHTGDGVFCAIERPDDGDGSTVARVGLDAESVTRVRGLRMNELTRRWFSDAEQSLFFADPTEEVFLQIWTRKEALVKWTGEGMGAMKKADTVNAEQVYGVRFKGYAQGESRITLCHRANGIPPSSVQMLTYEELASLCRCKEASIENT